MSKDKFKPLWTESGLLIATDFIRVEKGGRGNYIEISKDQICLHNLYIPEDKQWKLTSNKVDYIEFRTKRDNIKIYYQVNTQYVDYANYYLGFYYVSPKDIFRKKPVILDDF